MVFRLGYGIERNSRGVRTVKIRKVFTKYDSIPREIIVPSVPEIEATDFSEGTDIMDATMLNLHANHLQVKKVKDGLEGVVFIDYEDKT